MKSIKGTEKTGKHCALNAIFILIAERDTYPAEFVKIKCTVFFKITKELAMIVSINLYLKALVVTEKRNVL